MKSKMTCSSLVALCGAGLLALTTTSLAQNATPATPTKPSKAEAPKQPAKGEAPKAAQPANPAADQAAMMEMWMKASTPGKEHEHLMKGCGTWEGKTKMWMEPGGTPSESTCTTVISSMMGGRFTKSETKGTISMGGPPMPFEGFGTWGYNNTTKQYEGTWVDNMGTLTMFFTGTLSPDGKTLTATSKFTDCMTGKETWMREVEKITGPDTMTLEMYGPSPDGKEFKVMEIAYTRKAGTSAAPAKATDAKAPDTKSTSGGK